MRTRRVLIWMCIVALAAWSALPAHGQRRRARPRAKAQKPARGGGFSADAVDAAIERAIAYLWKTQKGNGSWDDKHNGSYPLGASALATYALLESGVNVEDPRMQKALGFLAYTTTEKTYTLGIRANVYLAAMAEDATYREALIRDVVQIVRSTKDGSYNYKCKADGKSSGDNSNSQYGLLGVWAGARANLEISDKYWKLVQKHWTNCQNSDGGWGYRRGATKATMTAAGVASLFVCYDNLLLNDPGVTACRTSAKLASAQKPIQAGLDWFDKNFAKSLKDSSRQYYYLYGVERVGLASGYKYFGKVDWYKMGATKLLGSQSGGSWGGKIPETAFGLLFLIRGRNAVAFNKLRFTGDWNNRPRDLANLTRWLTGKIEGTVNWQIINLSVPVAEWHDSPILYISGAKAPKFTDGELASLRTFVHQGGTIFAVTECNGSGFTEGMYNAYAEMFPNYRLRECPEDHPLYNVYYRLRGKPRFKIVSNGVRPLVIHTTEDLSREWQHGNVATRKHTFEAAANVYMYVTDKLSSQRRRGTTLWPARAGGGGRKVTVTRLKYKGNYDPEPLAFERFRRLMAREHKIDVKVAGPLAIGELGKSGARLATLTGTEAFVLSDGEIKALKAFVDGGGTLLMDAAGGDARSKGFADSAKSVAVRMYPAQRLRTLVPSAPLYNLPGMRIGPVRWRRGTKVRMVGVKNPMIRAVVVNNRPGVLVSAHDITAALVGYPSASVYGYHQGNERDVGTAFQLMRNIVLYAHGGGR